jgi:pimeloyl-ACP methyl ester carboxylesterase
MALEANGMALPWLPPGHTMVLPGRGEMFYRHHQHPDPTAPTLLLLHGWTASSDLQFFTAYETLAEHFSFVGVDHRGHGRGLRSPSEFELHDAADDAALVLRQLGIDQVVTVGYSMGGPISMHLARRHPELVCGMVVQATALEWRASTWERVRWKGVGVVGSVLRSRVYQRWIRHGISRLLGRNHPLLPYVPWLASEVHRNDAGAIVQAGRALGAYDASSWARQLGQPAASLITTKDRLVPPRKQRALATALDAFVVELADDHLASWTSPTEFAAITLQLVQHVVA